MAIAIADSSCNPPMSSLGFLLDPEKFEPPRPKQSMWHRLGLRRLLGRDDRDFSFSRSLASGGTSPASKHRSKRTTSPLPKSHDNLTRRLSRRVGASLPRSTTFKRQHSEHRDRLPPADTEQRRAVSADRHTLSLQRTKSPQAVVDPRSSAPEVQWREDPDPDQTKVDESSETIQTNEEKPQESDVRSEWDHHHEATDAPEAPPAGFHEMDFERRWILNLSMHFRDGSEREKFFVTYAEAPNRWRRVTISCDYRDAEPDSLEQDLRELRYQRDKCARIYDSIRDSLPDIQFYDTVTNLKLETRDGRLHVHVTEDVNEIIPYPPISCIGHLPELRLIPEHRLLFEAHLSGFVYNVRLNGGSFIKKEIPGPDTVDEFLYEINALHALQGTPNVIQVEGIVVDDRREVVKGLLIGFAEKGALVDILYEYRGTIAWERRERWARQIVSGLCEIHEAGYVQGDFTLSNIVVDANDNAKIIDINRRGCPVGWEPPEIADKIESNQRISMYIGVKTDLFQLGMTLWALAMEEDEPERQRRPFVLDEELPVPDYYRRIVSICLSPTPRHRLSAKELLSLFPRATGAFDQLPGIHPLGLGDGAGALPLYDSRAAFLSPRGRQMGSPERRPSDHSFTINREKQSLQSELDDMDECRPIQPHGQPNGVWKENSMVFDERRSADDPSLITMEAPAPPADIREALDYASLDYEQREIEFNAGASRLQRNTSTSVAATQSSNASSLPNELDGVGGFSVSSRSLPSPEIFTPQSAGNLNPAGSGSELYTDQEPPHSVSSLLQSALPINPATETLEQGSAPISRQATPDSTSAVKTPMASAEKGTAPGPSLKTGTEVAEKAFIDTLPDFRHVPLPAVDATAQNALLGNFQLPINPAMKSPEDFPKASNLQTDTRHSFTVRHTLPFQHSLQGHISSLRDSRLPINPAFSCKVLQSI
ncbi:hypothetical protein BJX61DRAFT_532714 [Aspergillus egyptiacus]|nr:hypothetical protein BJX61DRAFT_532714 [Aspergillus egyptiacus]